MFLVLTISMVSADILIEYNIYDSIQEDDGSYTDSTTPTTGFNVMGYLCSDAVCSTVTGTFLTDTNVASGTGYQVMIPTGATPQDVVLHFTHDDYIGWEEILNVQGVGTPTVPTATYDIYLTQKQSGFAPINNLNVVNQVNAGLPIEVSFSVGVDAVTYAAINDIHTTGIPFSEDVETQVDLEITNSTGDVIYTDTQTLNIPYDGSLPVSFTYAGFANTGDYSVSVSTNVTDAKILSSTEQSTTSNIQVIPQASTDYAYTLINNLAMTPTIPEEGDLIQFSFDHDSNYIDALGASSNIDTRLVITIYRDSSQTESFIVGNEASGTYTFSRTYNQDGSYRLEVYGEPENAASYNNTIDATQELTFIVGEPTTNNNDDDDDDDDDDEEDEGLFLLSLASGSSDDDSSIHLGSEKHYSIFQIFLWTLLWLILLLIAIILMILYPELWFWILVGFLVLFLIFIGFISLKAFLWLLLIALIILGIASYFKYGSN